MYCFSKVEVMIEMSEFAAYDKVNHQKLVEKKGFFFNLMGLALDCGKLLK